MQLAALAPLLLLFAACRGAGCDSTTAAAKAAAGRPSPLPVKTLGVSGARGPTPRPREPGPVRYLKGQTHVHTANSPDSITSPDEAARWYETNGYDFIVITDHDHVTQLDWPGELLVVPGVELTQTRRECDPPPAPYPYCFLHVNALFADPSGARIEWPPRGFARRELLEGSLGAVRTLGALAQLNHPEAYDAVDARTMVHLAERGLALVEIANQAVDPAQVGGRPSAEQRWDEALTLGAVLWGVASDDAHHYGDEHVEALRQKGGDPHMPGRGFVMVRASKDEAAIREALLRGDFYASTGVILDRAEKVAGALEVAVSDESPGPHTITFIGAGGRVLSESQGRRGRLILDRAPAGYVRAVVTDPAGKKAWVQPVPVSAPVPVVLGGAD